MYDVDTELRLLGSDPIVAGGVPIQHVSLERIMKFGYNRYHEVLSYLSIGRDGIEKMTDGDVKDVSPAAFLYVNAASREEFWNILKSGFELFVGQSPVLNDSDISFTFPEFSIDEGNFDSVQEMIRVRNGIKPVEEADENPSNERARMLLERRRQLREKLAKAKHKESGSLNLADLISIFASAMKMPISDVMKYDMYQFDDQFARLRIMDDYQMGIQAILHGAKSDDVELKHWMCKIQNEDMN